MSNRYNEYDEDTRLDNDTPYEEEYEYEDQ